MLSADRGKPITAHHGACRKAPYRAALWAQPAVFPHQSAQLLPISACLGVWLEASLKGLLEDHAFTGLAVALILKLRATFDAIALFRS